ncbi:unnamed protein product [Spirodela intermedia]|uniref:Uncharacterized protein n=1 Tax=Spirodela intermedia TaxID=51605 RepID=A0A7I8IJV4_SPIIN|nr:unnamed protein product [Spirodela intermedia]CAA6658118.1 unnamed protein product [Spirodela intermedia]
MISRIPHLVLFPPTIYRHKY